jgi:hypothetical protein
MLINQPVKNDQFHSFFDSLSSFKSFLFVLSILTFFAFPILGCIPILLLLQVRISQRFLKKGNLKKQDKSSFNLTNLTCLFLVIFATTIYLSTGRIFSDLDVYLNIYRALSGLDVYGFINNFPQQYYTDVEPLAFFIPHLAGMLLGHTDSLFILVNSLTFSLVFTFIAYKFFPLSYPLIILINITSFYYFQTNQAFRQSYSFIFLLPMALTPSIVLNTAFLVLAYFSHRSSVLYSIPLLFLSISFFLEKFTLIKLLLFKKRKLLMLISLLIIPAFSFLLNLYSGLNESVFRKNEIYGSESYSTDASFPLLLSHIFPELILLIIILGFLKPKKLTSRDYIETSFFVVALVSLVMMIFTFSSSLITLFLRPVMSWSGLKGFFYPILFSGIQKIRAENEGLSRFLFTCLISLASLSIIKFLIFNFLSILFAFLGGDLLNSWKGAEPYFPYYFNPILRGFTYPNYFWDDDLNLPTVATNLFDFSLRFYHLIRSISG